MNSFNKKSIAYLSITLGLSFALLGCGGGESPSVNTAPTPTPTPTPTPSFPQPPACPGSNCDGTSSGYTPSNFTGYTYASYPTPSIPSGQSYNQRALPSGYLNAKAINYSPYRAAGPGSETPTAAQIGQDLQLLSDAGFTLLRLFSSDTNSENVLNIAKQHFPNLRFQLGIYLFGATSGHTCLNEPQNTSQVTNGILLANKYSNVATVSVGNETSFARDGGANLPVPCVLGFVQQVKSQTPTSIPITADDDFSYYVNTDPTNGPNTLLPYLDFASIHIYAINGNESQWNWKSYTSGASMMAAALAWVESKFSQVAAHGYTTLSSQSATIGSQLPIVIGETGWKSAQTNSSEQIEQYAGNPVNQKWWYDNMQAWQTGSNVANAAAPGSVFTFEGTNESWKGSDDGWGLWTSSRTPQFVWCGIPLLSSQPCTGGTYTNVFDGLGYYKP
jgi:exo-beta-1,3-glucanase (GH17 family)